MTRSSVRLLIAALTIAVSAGAVPPGRQHVLKIEGENTVSYIPRLNLPPVKIEYEANVEYVVDTRIGDDELKPPAGSKSTKKTPATVKVPGKGGKSAPVKVDGRVDLSLHSATFHFLQNGQEVTGAKLSRSRFVGRLLPEAPAVDVSASSAPPRLSEILKTFDATAATLLLDADSRVVSRTLRNDLPLHALVETLLSIHTPIPRDVASWEAPTRLAMGHGQTAKGLLKFEKDKASASDAKGLVKVRVSGTLRADGVVAGRLIKDGTYAVTGEQSYDPATREWRTAEWEVAIDNELASQGGQTVAHARGKMLVKSRGAGENEARPSEERP
jgi:hypothetical protein